MSLSKEEVTLLGDLDDDFYGLWEVDWHFNGAHPEWSREKRTTFFSVLLQRGLIEVFFGPPITERSPLAPDEALRAVADPDSWAPPTEEQEIGYYVTTSSTGAAVLQARGS